jgi:hypothetical protein
LRSKRRREFKRTALVALSSVYTYFMKVRRYSQALLVDFFSAAEFYHFTSLPTKGGGTALAVTEGVYSPIFISASYSASRPSRV